MKLSFNTGITSLLAASVAFALIGAGATYGATATKKSPAKPSTKAPVVKPAPKAPAVPAEVKWETKTMEKATFDVPSTWKQDKGSPAFLSVWYVGSKDAPDGAFAIMWEDAPIDQLLASGGMKKVGTVEICGITSTEYAVSDTASSFQGMAVIADKAEADGRRMIIAAGSATGQWKKHEPTLRKIVASIKVKTAK